MADAAVRLMRRSLGAVEGVATSFAGAAASYAAEGAWIDEARRLIAEGDHVAALAEAYSAQAASVNVEQRERAHRFAELLAEWSVAEPLPDPRIVPVECILDEIVSSAAASSPVLLVVCDGLGLPVWHRLRRDLLREGWAPAAPEDRDDWPVGVAMLPTVTEASRASLLTGRRCVGGQVEEHDGFAAHTGLRAVSTPALPPVLVHKAGLVGPSGIALPDEVQRVVADPDQRVVGVVVNSVDDHLARGDQIRVGWDLLSLRPLPWLLDAAAEAGRVVIVTADHGHVLHGPDAAVRQCPGGGERWRTTPPPAGEAEVRLHGPRVVLGDGDIVAPSDDRLRYGGYKHGYHGGATPEEVLVPVAVLARRLPPGWSHRPVAHPNWWSDGEPPLAATPTVRAAPLGTELSGRPARPPTLFDTVEANQPTWSDRLLAAPAFVAHRGQARLPRPLPADRLRNYLAAIEQNGGTIPLEALSVRTGEPPDTLRMALTLVQRLVNLDGAEVLAVRADGTVILNRELAELQFDVKP
jgi:hypothetical protein